MDGDKRAQEVADNLLSPAPRPATPATPDAEPPAQPSLELPTPGRNSSGSAVTPSPGSKSGKRKRKTSADEVISRMEKCIKSLQDTMLEQVRLMDARRGEEHVEQLKLEKEQHAVMLKLAKEKIAITKAVGEAANEIQRDIARVLGELVGAIKDLAHKL